MKMHSDFGANINRKKILTNNYNYFVAELSTLIATKMNSPHI